MAPSSQRVRDLLIHLAVLVVHAPQALQDRVLAEVPQDHPPERRRALVRNIYRKVRVRNRINMLLRFITEARGPATGREDIRPMQVPD